MIPAHILWLRLAVTEPASLQRGVRGEWTGQSHSSAFWKTNRQWCVPRGPWRWGGGGEEKALICSIYQFPWCTWVSLVVQTVKNLPAMQETWVQSLGRENSLEEHMATHSSILVWRIPTGRGAWWPTVHGVAESDATEQLSTAHSRSSPTLADFKPSTWYHWRRSWEETQSGTSWFKRRK